MTIINLIHFICLSGFVDKYDIEKLFQYSTTVKKVEFDPNDGKFSVIIESRGCKAEKVFDYVVVATGHFSWPENPSFEGEKNFSGRIIHAHE